MATFAKVCEQMGARLLACDGEDDHVHYPPKLEIAALVNALEGTQQAITQGDAACRRSILARRAVDAELFRRERRRHAPCVLSQYVEQQRASSPA